MATIGLKEFWDSLDDSQRLHVLLVHKYELIQQLSDENDKYLCVSTVCTIEEEMNQLNSLKTLHQDSLTLNLSSDGIYDLAVLPANAVIDFGKRENEFALCFPGEFLVSKAAMDKVIRNFNSERYSQPVNYFVDRVCLCCLDMLTYPRPVRKFKLIVEKQVPISDLRSLLAADVGIDEEELVIMIRGKEIPRDDTRNMQQLGVKEDQQVVISKRLGTPSPPSSQTVDRSRQFVGDLLFRHNSSEEQKSYTVAKLFNVTQGYQLLPLLLERRVIENILDLYLEDQKARAHEAELIELLEMEKEGRHLEDEKKKKKKQKKKEKVKRRKEQSHQDEASNSRSTTPTNRIVASNAAGAEPSKKVSNTVRTPLMVHETHTQAPREERFETLGTSLADVPPIHCVSCGTSLDAGHRFCWNCGTAAPRPIEPVRDECKGPPVAEVATQRRRRKNQSSALQPAVTASKHRVDDVVSEDALEKLHETRTNRLPSAETDDDSGSLAADYYIMEQMYRKNRSNSRDSSIEGFLAAVSLDTYSGSSASRLPIFKQLGQDA